MDLNLLELALRGEKEKKKQLEERKAKNQRVKIMIWKKQLRGEKSAKKERV